MNTRLFSFEGGNTGPWLVLKVEAITGEPLTVVQRLNIAAGEQTKTSGGQEWLLRGVTSNERYVQRTEKNELVARQPALGRPEATLGALIPLRKNKEWWSLTQDERRQIFEETSKHIQIGMRYLPAVARRLHHCRDLGGNEPFDFLTWFEYAPSDAGAFDELLVQLRDSEEWKYVDREVDIRLVKE
jgi:chlorite dismutase